MRKETSSFCSRVISQPGSNRSIAPPTSTFARAVSFVTVILSFVFAEASAGVAASVGVMAAADKVASVDTTAEGEAVGAAAAAREAASGLANNGAGGAVLQKSKENASSPVLLLVAAVSACEI